MEKRLNIVIPTRNRSDKLIRFLDSLPREEWINIYIGVDSEKVTKPNLKHYNFKGFGDVIITEFENKASKKNLGSVAIRNLMGKTLKGDMFYCVDDVICITPQLLIDVYDEFCTHFPDSDGILGIGQQESCHPTGLTIIGAKMMKNFPARRAYCPSYFHFAAQELQWLGEKLEKIAYSDITLIKHYHPCLYKEESDKTHADGRVNRDEDTRVRRWRQEHNMIWGFNKESSENPYLHG